MAKKNNTNMLLLGLGAVAVIYFVTKPKPAAIVPYGTPGYLPPAAGASNPITSLINLFKGTGGGSSQSSAPAGQSYYTDASGNVVDQNGNIVSQAYSGSSGGSSGGGYTPSGSGDITSSGTTDLGSGNVPDPTIDEMNLYD